jgi:Fe-S-cluster formation regulator IscX/YfhJ
MLVSETKMIPFLVSKPGVGKTAWVQQYANEHNKSLVILNAATIDELDLGGMPEKVGDVVKFLPPSWLKADIIFFDEIDRVRNQSVYSALLSLFRDRKINGHEFKGSIICAGNQEFDDQCTIFDQKSAFFDRLVRVDFEYTVDEVKQYLRSGFEGSMLREWICSIVGQTEHSPRRLTETLILGEDFVKPLLGPKLHLEFLDFKKGEIPLDQFFDDPKKKKTKFAECALLAILGSNLTAWLNDKKRSEAVEELYKSTDHAEAKLAFKMSLRASYRKDSSLLKDIKNSLSGDVFSEVI